MFKGSQTYNSSTMKGHNTKTDKHSSTYNTRLSSQKDQIDPKVDNNNFYFKKGKKIQGKVAQSLQNMNFSSYLNSQKENLDTANSNNALKQFLQKKKEKDRHNINSNNIVKTNILKNISNSKNHGKIIANNKNCGSNDVKMEEGNNTSRKNDSEKANFNLLINTNQDQRHNSCGVKSVQVSPRTFEEARRTMAAKKESGHHHNSSNSIDLKAAGNLY